MSPVGALVGRGQGRRHARRRGGPHDALARGHDGTLRRHPARDRLRPAPRLGHGRPAPCRGHGAHPHQPAIFVAPRSTSPSALPWPRPRARPGRSCCPTSRPSASSGAMPRSSSRRATPSVLHPLARLGLEPRQRAFPARRDARPGRRGHDARALEPEDGWSRSNLCADQQAARQIAAFHRGLSRAELTHLRAGFRPRGRAGRRRCGHRPRMDRSGAGRRIGAPGRGRALHPAVPRHAPPRGHARGRHRGSTCRDTTACWPSARRCASATSRRLGRQVFTWHEAADDTSFRPLPASPRRAISSGSATGATANARRN
jgi:hypothetical protein